MEFRKIMKLRGGRCKWIPFQIIHLKRRCAWAAGCFKLIQRMAAKSHPVREFQEPRVLRYLPVAIIVMTFALGFFSWNKIKNKRSGNPDEGRLSASFLPSLIGIEPAAFRLGARHLAVASCRYVSVFVAECGTFLGSESIPVGFCL